MPRRLVGRNGRRHRRHLDLRHHRLARGERDQLTAHLGNLLRIHVAERIAQPANRPRVELRDARFVDANLGADLLHRDFAVVVEADHFALAPRQRLNRGAHAVACLGFLVGGVG